MALLLTTSFASAQYIPRELRDAAEDWPTDQLPTFIRQTIDFKPFYEYRTIQSVWRSKQGDCTGMNSIYKALLSTKGVRTNIVFGSAKCQGRWQNHDYLIAKNGSIYDVFGDICEEYNARRLG